MKTISEDLFFEVLASLFEQWLSVETIEQIREDEDKVRLMLSIQEAISEPPKHIAEFYTGVFLRDNWNSYGPGTAPGSAG